MNPSHTDRTQAKILVIDDLPANLNLVCETLEPENYEILAAPGGEIALQIVRRTVPDLILLDIVMKGLDGIETCRRFKANPRTAHIPVIFITIKDEIERIVSAFHVGGVDYITKPFQKEEMLSRVRTHLKIGRLAKALSDKNAELSQRADDLTRLNRRLQQEIASRQRAEKQLIQQERVRVIEQMGAGIAHNINNSLMPILGYTDLLLNTPEKIDTQTVGYLRTINTAASDIATTVRGLRELYLSPSDRRADFVPVDLNALILQTITLTQPTWKTQKEKHNIAINVKTKLKTVPPVHGDSVELRSALTSLIFNAVEAIHDGGTIGFDTSFDGNLVRLKVSDTGVGMTKEVQQRCFDPFFTTKHGRGSGLGLATVYHTIARHKGQINVESIPGKGTTFTVLLPTFHENVDQKCK